MGTMFATFVTVSQCTTILVNRSGSVCVCVFENRVSIRLRCMLHAILENVIWPRLVLH